MLNIKLDEDFPLKFLSNFSGKSVYNSYSVFAESVLTFSKVCSSFLTLKTFSAMFCFLSGSTWTSPTSLASLYITIHDSTRTLWSETLSSGTSGVLRSAAAACPSIEDSLSRYDGSKCVFKPMWTHSEQCMCTGISGVEFSVLLLQARVRYNLIVFFPYLWINWSSGN